MTRIALVSTALLAAVAFASDRCGCARLRRGWLPRRRLRRWRISRRRFHGGVSAVAAWAADRSGTAASAAVPSERRRRGWGAGRRPGWWLPGRGARRGRRGRSRRASGRRPPDRRIQRCRPVWRIGNRGIVGRATPTAVITPALWPRRRLRPCGGRARPRGRLRPERPRLRVRQLCRHVRLRGYDPAACNGYYGYGY